MAYSEAEPYVCPESMCLGEGLYVEFFLLVLPVSSEQSPNFGIEEDLTQSGTCSLKRPFT